MQEINLSVFTFRPELSCQHLPSFMPVRAAILASRGKILFHPQTRRLGSKMKILSNCQKLPSSPSPCTAKLVYIHFMFNTAEWNINKYWPYLNYVLEILNIASCPSLLLKFSHTSLFRETNSCSSGNVFFNLSCFYALNHNLKHPCIFNV